MDANLNHCLATGRSVTGCLHFVNHTPIDSYSKRQATVETATYGSEFVASKTATEQIIDLRHTLRYLGVPIKTKSNLFGDNRSVVTSSTLPHSTLGKRHNILAYHRVREAIASKILAYHWIRTGYNLGDMLSKHWDHPSVYNMIIKASDLKRTHHIDTKTSYSRQTNLTINVQNLYNDIQHIFLQEGSNRILSREPKSFVSCSHMNCCLQKYTTHQFTYFIYYLFQD